MKIAVTGGAGFLGSHVADALSDAGHDVIILDVTKSDYLRNDQSMVECSILDFPKLVEVIAGCDAVYHFAALADLDEAIGLPQKTIEINVIGTANVLEASRQAGIKRFVFASSIYVYSNQGSFYRTSKQAGEHLVQDFNERYGLAYTILRFGSLYGPRANKSNSVFNLLSQALQFHKINYAGSGKEVREYIHVHDAAATSVDILDDEYKNGIAHLTGSERMTTGDMLEMISEIMGGNIEVEVNQGEMTGHYVQTPYSYTPKIGRKLVRNSYIDLGLGLLDCLQHIDQKRLQDETAILEDPTL